MLKEMDRVHSLRWKGELKLCIPPFFRAVTRSSFSEGSDLLHAPEEESPIGLAFRHSHRLSFYLSVDCPSTSLHPFAPQALPCFLATMGTLTPAQRVLRALIRGNELPPFAGQVSLLHSLQPSMHSVTKHLTHPVTASPLPAQRDRLPGLLSESGLHLESAGSSLRTAESCSSSYGLHVRPRLLPTPPHGDAVTFGYQERASPEKGLSPFWSHLLAGARIPAFAGMTERCIFRLFTRPTKLTVAFFLFRIKYECNKSSSPYEKLHPYHSMKVIIVGASISGLFTAYLLAKEGVEVEVYERTDILGWPPRTLIVTSELKNVLHFLPDEAIINKVRYLELFSKSNSAKLELRIPDLVIEREKFVTLLARFVQEAGARIVLKHQCEGFAQFGNKVAVRLRNLETNEERQSSADILVGADGTRSSVTHAVSRNGHLLTALLQARVLLPDNVKSDTCQVWFDSDQTKYFYWLIPESDRTAAVGLIADDARQAEACLTGFLQERHLKPLEFQSAMVPMYRFGFVGDVLSDDRNVFAVGDAAAQVKVTTFGGVVTGLHGAKALTYAILNGRNYPKALRELKIEMNLHLLVRQILNRFSGGDYDELIGMINGGLKDILEEWTRDELKQSFLRMIWTEPRLIKLVAKAFLKSLL